MNRKAFTLIELMGVITILGLISLLIAPTIINQIRNNKDEIDKVTEKLIYSATELYIDSKQSEYPKNDGSVYCLTLRDLVDDGKLSSPVLDSSGNEISLDKIIAVDVTYNNYNYRMPATCEANITYRNGIMVSADSCIVDGTCLNGTEVNVRVSNSENYKFYVINDTGTEVTLIMDRNLGDNVAWINASDYNTANSEEGDNTSCRYTACNDEGPTTAVAALKERTSSWTNIPEKEYTYSDDGGRNKYTAFTETMRVRMLTYTETLNLGCKEYASDGSASNTCPSWLYINLYNTGSDTDESGNTRYGYWTSAAYASNYNSAHFIRYNGTVYYGYTFTTGYGLRPVIELYK